MYRAFAWFVLEHAIDINDSKAIEKALAQFQFEIVEKNKEKHYLVCGHDVTEVIRSRPVTAHSSLVSALKPVRAHLLDIQHQFAQKQNAVFEGRDLGTVVFPYAEFKIFLVADPKVRAERRLLETLAKNPQAASQLSHEELLADMIRRDEQDSNRQIAPLRCAEDAHQIDTTHLSIDQVVDEIVKYTQVK